MMFHPERKNISDKIIKKIIFDFLKYEIFDSAAGKSKRIYKKIKKPKSLLKINNFSIIENILRNITHKK